MLDIVVHLDLDALPREHLEEGVDGAVPGGIRRDLVLAHPQVRVERDLSGHVARRAGTGELEAPPLVVGGGGGEVLVLEDLPNLVAGDLATLGIGLGLDDAAELDLELPRQIERVVGLE